MVTEMGRSWPFTVREKHGRNDPILLLQSHVCSPCMQGLGGTGGSIELTGTVPVDSAKDYTAWTLA